MKVRKAVITAAGWGTRFLPLTKSLPKEMLPLLNKPLIQYSVEEAVACGVELIIIVTSMGKRAIEDYFDRSPELERMLESRGENKQLAEIRRLSSMVDITYIRQTEQLGLGHAVLVAKELVGNEPFAVLLGDVIIPGPNPATRQLVDVYEATGLGAIAVEDVPRAKTGLYGIVDVEPPSGTVSRTMKIRDMVEKPSPADAPSTLAVTGRYVLPPEIFDCLERTKPGRGGEIQLTDALRLLAKERGLLAYVYEGKSHDAGDKLGFLKATVEIGLENQEFGGEFREYLRSLKL